VDDEKTRHIKLAGKGTASTVSNDPGSVRYHPNLYGKLSKVLRDAGVPAPTQENRASASRW
jgi:hypothetical protein